MSPDPQSPANPEPAATAARFDRNGATVHQLALRIIGSPGAAWHATVAAFSAVAERVPPNAPPGTDDRDLLLMGCWHARQMLGQMQAHPDYAAQLRAHDAAQGADALPPVARANQALPVDQREVLALQALSGLGHAELAALLGTDPNVLARMTAQAQQMLHDALPSTQPAGGADAAGELYRSWPVGAAPTGLREAVLAALAPPAATSSPPASPGPVAPRGGGGVPPRSVDPHATVEWSPGEVAALGLGGPEAGVVGRPPEPLDDDEEWEEPWDVDADAPGERLQPVDHRRRAPRWQIGLVAVLLIAVVIALVLALTRSDDPTPASPTTPTTTKKQTTTKKTSTRNRSAAPTGATVATIRLPAATVRVVL